MKGARHQPGKAGRPPGEESEPHVLEEEGSARDRGGRAASLEKGLRWRPKSTAGRDKRAPGEAEAVRWKPARRLEELPTLGHQRYSLPAAGRVSEATGTCACVGVHTCASAWVCV